MYHGHSVDVILLDFHKAFDKVPKKSGCCRNYLEFEVKF